MRPVQMEAEHQEPRQDEALLRGVYLRLDRLLDEWLKWVLCVLQCPLPLEVPLSREASTLTAEVVQYLRGVQKLKADEALAAWRLRTQLFYGVQDNAYFFTAFHIILWEMGQLRPSEKVVRCWRQLAFVCEEWVWSEETDTTSGESANAFKRSSPTRWQQGSCLRQDVLEASRAARRVRGWGKVDDDDTDWETEDGDEEETDYDEDLHTLKTFKTATVERVDGNEEGEGEQDESSREGVWQGGPASPSRGSSFYLSSRTPHEEEETGDSRSPLTQSVGLSFSTHRLGEQGSFGRRQSGQTEGSPLQFCEGGSTGDEDSSDAGFNKIESRYLKEDTLTRVRIAELMESLQASCRAVCSLLGALCPGIAWADASWTVSWGFETLKSGRDSCIPEKSPFRGILGTLSERRFGCCGRQLVRVSLELDDKWRCFYKPSCQQDFLKNGRHAGSFAGVQARGASGDNWKGIDLLELQRALEGKVDDGFEYEGKLSKLSKNRFYRGTRQTICFSAPVAQRREEVFESWNPRVLLQMVKKKTSPMAVLLYLRLIREEFIVPWSKMRSDRSKSSESRNENDEHPRRMRGWSIPMAVLHGFIHALVHHTFHSLDSLLRDVLGISVRYTGSPGFSAARFPLSEALMLEVIATLVQISVARDCVEVFGKAEMEKTNTSFSGGSEGDFFENFNDVSHSDSKDLFNWPRCQELILLCERRCAMEIFPRGTAAVLTAKSLLFTYT